MDYYVVEGTSQEAPYIFPMLLSVLAFCARSTGQADFSENLYTSLLYFEFIVFSMPWSTTVQYVPIWIFERKKIHIFCFLFISSNFEQIEF